MAAPECASIDPELREVRPGHLAACIRLDGYWEDGSSMAEKLIVRDADRTINA
jgi:hypothetical protein